MSGSSEQLEALRPAEGRPRWLGPAMRYPGPYVWFVFVSSLDVMLTWLILSFRGSSEVNPIANAVIEHWGLPGTIGFKFSLVLFVIIVCEVVGRRRDWLGLWLARVAVIVSSLPVVYSLALLLYHFVVLGETPEVQ